MTLVTAGKLNRPCFRSITSKHTQSRQQFYVWSKCLSSTHKNHEQGSSSPAPSISDSVKRREKTTAPAFNVSKPPLKVQNRKQAIEAQGVSVIYQQSATTKHRRGSSDVDHRKPIRSRPGASTSGGSVVAPMSATERYRQQRRSGRQALQPETARDTTKTNPSLLRLPVDDTFDYNDFEDMVVEKPRPASDETKVEAATQDEFVEEKKSMINMRNTTITLVFLSSLAYIVSTLPVDFSL